MIGHAGAVKSAGLLDGHTNFENEQRHGNGEDRF